MATKLTSTYQYIGRSNAVSCPNGYNYYILLYAKTAANDATGKHTVSVRQYLACSNDSTFHGWNTSGYVKVGGTNAVSWTNAKVPAESWGSSASLTVGGYTYRRHVLLKEGSVVVSNCFGADKEVTISTSWVMNDSYSAGWFPYTGKYATASIAVTLAGIAGASAPTLSATAAKMGEVLTITTNRMSSAFTHTLKYTFGGQTVTIATGVGVSYKWTIPDIASLCNDKVSDTCAISCTTYNGTTVIGTETVSFTLSVPAATVPELSNETLDMGEALTITANGKSANFKHTLIYSFEGSTGTIGIGITGSVSRTFAIKDFAKLIPTKTSGLLTIKCITYNGTAKVGETSAAVTLTVPNNSETRPALSMVLSPSPTDAVSNAFKGSVSFAGMYIQTKSKVSAVFDASSEVSSIASYELIVGSKSKNSESSSIESDLIDTSGEITVTGKVTDARGYATEVSQQITVYAYASPKVTPYTGKTNAVCERSLSDGTINDAGTYLLIQAGKGYSSVGGKNVCMLRYRYKLSTASGYGSYNTLLDWNNSVLVYSGVIGSGSFAATQSYDVELSVEDALGGENTIEFSVPTDEVDFNLNHNKAAFGKYAEKDGTLEVDWYLEANKGLSVGDDFRIDPDIKTITGGYSFDGKAAKASQADTAKSADTAESASNAGNATKLDSKTLAEILLLMNPVGTIVMNITGQNPSEYIGGTWEAWSGGRFPLGLGAPEQNSSTTFGSLTEQELNMNFTVAGATGGTYRHTLTVSQIPAHTHTVNNAPGFTAGSAWVGASGSAEATPRATTSTGGGAEHNNMPPYTTCYMWKRTA